MMYVFPFSGPVEKAAMTGGTTVEKTLMIVRGDVVA